MSDIPKTLHGETDPVVIRAALALAKMRSERIPLDDWLQGIIVTPDDIADARTVLATVGMLRAVP